MIPFGQDETVKVDQAHADLLTGLIVSIYTKCKDMGLSHKLFNLNSLPTERCERGLLVIFK